MKYLIFTIIIVSLACSTAKQTTAPIVFQPQKPIVSESNLVPFTRELYNKMKESKKINIGLLQFYISNTIVLNQGIVKDEISVGTAGELKTEIKKTDKIIEILAFTPGVIESVDSEGMMIRFEKGDKKTLRFINNKYSPSFFSLSGNNWSNGTAFVDYANTSYLASCGDCNTLSNVKLLIKKVQFETIEKEVHQVEGMKSQEGIN